MPEIETWADATEAFDSMLDEIYPMVDLGFTTLLVSRALREVDPIAYRTAFHDWSDAEGINEDELIGPDTLPD